MKFIKQAIKVTPETHEAVQRKLLKQGYKLDVPSGAKRMAAEEFLKDVMEPFYIYTPTPKISQEVQKRLFELGYEWCHGSKNEILEESYCLHLLKVDIFWKSQKFPLKFQWRKFAIWPRLLRLLCRN